MSPHLFTLRKASPIDASGIETLYRQFVSSPDINVTKHRIETISADANTLLLVCELDTLIVATALVSLCQDVMFGNQPFAVVENFVVDDSKRSQGIGKQLMLEIEKHCTSTNCSKIMLLSSSHRESAHRFFTSCGFLSEGKRAFVKYRSHFAQAQ